MGTRAGKLLSRLGSTHTARAQELLHRGVGLVKLSHDDGEANLSHEIMDGNLTTSIPGPNDDEIRDDAVLRKEDFVWSEHEFNEGEKENKRVLRKFKAEFKKM